MRFRQFYTFLVLSLWVFATQAQVQVLAKPPLGRPAKTAVPKKVEMHPARSFFDAKIAECKTQLAKAFDPKKKAEILRKYLGEIEDFRKKQEMSDVGDEVYMNLVIHSLQELPKPETFETSQCPFYKKQLLRDYEPTAGDSGKIEDPAIVEAVGLLAKVCS